MYIYIIYITFALIYCVNGVKCAWITELKKVAKTRKKIHARSGGGGLPQSDTTPSHLEIK